jgi:hypothetical protein
MGPLLGRIIAYLVARFGEGVMSWTLQKAWDYFTSQEPVQVGATAPQLDEEPYFWDDPCL